MRNRGGLQSGAEARRNSICCRLTRYAQTIWKAGYATVVILCAIPGDLRAQQNRLLPEPQSVLYGAGRVQIDGLKITFAATPSAEDRFAADQLADGLSRKTWVRPPIGESARVHGAIVLKRTGATDALPMPGEKSGPESREAYRLKIGANGVEIEGRSSAAIYYGVQTLLQLAGGKGTSASFPEVAIVDWPAFPYRGTLVDVGSEGPMSTVEQIERQLDLLAEAKGNQYWFYSEANIELDGYPLLNPGAHFSKDQIRQIVLYGRQRHIDIVPAIELYGHLHDLFRIERYSDLADFPHGGEFNPGTPKVKALLTDWISQLAMLFPSPFVDIGFDETFSIQKAAAGAGAGATPVKIFLEQLRTVTGLFQAHGKQVMAYADIMVKFPGIISELPPGLIALPWYYDPNPDPEYKQWLAPLVEHNVPHFVLSGLNSWDEVAPDFDLTFNNIDTLLIAGRKSGALGLVNTVWTDDGQMLMQMSWPGMTYGAAAAWQSRPMNRKQFFETYSEGMYSNEAAPRMARALTELNAAERSFQAAVGQESMAAVWSDPFGGHRMEQVKGHREDLRQCRLHAEKAEEYLYQARALQETAAGLPTMLVGARLLDYGGMKYLYALEMADSWATLPAHPLKAQLADVMSQGIASQVHSRTADLMDAIAGLKGPYRREWEKQYTDYRLETALGRWDAEYEYWRRAQARLEQFEGAFHDYDGVPPLEDLFGDSLPRR
jgi:hexosaminidase